MLLTSRIKVVSALWLVAEVLVFVAVADLIGLFGAILLGSSTTLLGFALLKRSGTVALARLRGQWNRSRDGTAGAILDDTLAAVGATALIVPGFLSDLLGLALSVPGVRSHATAWIGRAFPVLFTKPPTGDHTAQSGDAESDGFARTPRRRGPSAIDLDPGDWHRG